MPELPEVERIRRSLEPGLVGRVVVSVRVIRRDVIVAPGDPFGGFSRVRGVARPVRMDQSMLLVGGRVDSLLRHGKQLAVIDDRGRALIVGLGMTGRLDLSRVRPSPRHTHVVWTLDGGALLRFIDPRRFGLVRLAPEGPRSAWAGLGPDAATIRADLLAGALGSSLRSVKAALLDQGILAGVGNIYADEALHAAGIHPGRPARELGRAEIVSLAGAIRRVLAKAIVAGGSTIRDYQDGSGQAGGFQSQHRVYGRSGLPCMSCGGVLERGRIAQRTTVFCPRCQPWRGDEHRSE